MKRTLEDLRRNVFFETQSEFALRLGYHPGTVAAWEQGRRVPYLRTRRAIAARLGLSVLDIEWQVKESPVAA